MATSNVYLQIFETLGSSTLGVSGVSNKDFDSETITPIEVLDFSFAIEQQGSEEADGRAGFVERVDKTPLTVKKAVDATSPKLFEFCCKGSSLNKAVVLVYGPRVDRPYLTYTMHNVRIARYAPSGGEELATEEIDIFFGQMGVVFDKAGIGTAKNGNTSSGATEYTWNWVLQVPGFVPMPTEIPL